ncbi:MAG TPA: hypothetical protein VFA07_13900 [Chthonomonadaceae bacterium]|nr:hypothetical protein [Chthonomonadaceae bacterium]
MKRLAIRYTGSTGTGYPFEEYTMDDKAYEILLNDYESFLKTQQPGGGTYELSEHGVTRRLILNFAHITYIRLETAATPHTEGFPGQERGFPFATSAPKIATTTAEEEDRPLAQPTPVSPNKPTL